MNNIRTKIKNKESFIILPLKLSLKEIECIKKLKIKNRTEYTRVGKLFLLNNELTHFLNHVIQDDKNKKIIVKKISNIIIKLVNNIIKIFNKDSAMVMVRTSYHKGDWKIPRWHMDGSYFESINDVYKFVITLKGDTTLFYKKNDINFHKKVNNYDDELIKKNYKINKDDKNGNKYRITTDYKLKFSKIFKEKNYLTLNSKTGVLYLVGNRMRGCYHSEPYVTTDDRLFLSILPGTETEISTLDRFKRKYDFL